MIDALTLRIEGVVQGVFFRDHAVREAKKRDLTGYVKNAIDGSVRVYAEGKKDDLESLLAWCQRGPDLARVDLVIEEWKRIKKPTYKKFCIEY